MDMKYDFGDNDENKIAYVRPVAVIDLPQDVQDQAEGAEHLYALHSSDGTRLALVKDREMAFDLARQNDMEPLAVH